MDSVTESQWHVVTFCNSREFFPLLIIIFWRFFVAESGVFRPLSLSFECDCSCLTSIYFNTASGPIIVTVAAAETADVLVNTVVCFETINAVNIISSVKTLVFVVATISPP